MDRSSNVLQIVFYTSTNIDYVIVPKGVGFTFSALDFGSSGPGSRPGWRHCVVFLGKTLDSHSASLHTGV